LRDRGPDIIALAGHFLQRHSERYGKAIGGFEPAATQALAEYPWPGNVRELDHTVERAVLLARGSSIQADELGLRRAVERSEEAELTDLTLDQAERVLIQNVLRRCDGNVTEAAHSLGLSRSALYRRLKAHGL
jgi:DNA-binding NtrC family response regulator